MPWEAPVMRTVFEFRSMETLTVKKMF
jgi:hypothetical protein